MKKFYFDIQTVRTFTCCVEAEDEKTAENYAYQNWDTMWFPKDFVDEVLDNIYLVEEETQ